MSNGSHHVAWKDRLGLNVIWKENIIACYQSYGTEFFVNNVERLYNSIINIKDGPNLHDLVDIYRDDKLDPWKETQYNNWYESNIQDRRGQEHVERIKNEINYEAHKKLLNFILQLLEDNGFGFYKSDIKVDEISLTQSEENFMEEP